MSQNSSILTLPATLEAARRRHGSALLRYAIDLFDGDKRQAESAIARAWETLAHADESEEPGREVLFAQVRQHVLEAQRSAGALQRFEGGDDAVKESAAGGRVSFAVAAENAFARLTPKQQEALRLKFAHGFRHEQIAQITGLSPAHAALVIHTALSRVAHAARPDDGADSHFADDARVTLAALDELGPDARAALASGRRDPEELRHAIEQRREIAQQVAATIARGRKRSRRSARIAPRLRLIAGTVVGVAVIGVGLAIWLRRSEAGPVATISAREAKPEHAAGTARVAVQASDETATAGASGGAGEAESLGIFRVAPSPAKPRTTAAASTATIASVDPASTVTSHAASSETAPAEPAAVARGRVGAVTSRAPDATPKALVVSAKTLAPRADPAASEPNAPVAALVSVNSTDVAPITALRRALDAARWPRAEEVNLAAMRRHFSRAATAAPASEAVAVRAESAMIPWRMGEAAVRLTATAKKGGSASRAPANIVLLLDVSGSMAAPNRLPLVQETLGALLDLLQPEDRVGIVTYAGESHVLQPLASVREVGGLRAELGALEARGQTNGSAGLMRALAVVAADRIEHREHVVVLCTDGEFNFGQTSEEELVALVSGHVESGVRLAIFGFGRNGAIDPRLEALAARARGGSGYVNTRAEAVAVIARQLDPIFEPAARAARLEIDDGKSRACATAETLLPGETLDLIAAPSENLRGALRYLPMDADDVRELALAIDAKAAQFAAASDEFKFALLAHAVGEVLREGPAAAGRFAELARCAEETLPDDASGYRRELLALIERAQAAAGR